MGSMATSSGGGVGGGFLKVTHLSCDRLADISERLFLDWIAEFPSSSRRPK